MSFDPAGLAGDEQRPEVLPLPYGLCAVYTYRAKHPPSPRPVDEPPPWEQEEAPW